MSNADDLDLERLGVLDPSLGDAPPAQGSPRYNTILERAMTMATKAAPQHESATSIRRHRRWTRWAAAAAGIAATICAAALLIPGQPGSASAAVRTAAEHTGTVKTLRAAMKLTMTSTFDPETGKPTEAKDVSLSITGDFCGADSKILIGSPPEQVSETIVGDQRYTVNAPGAAVERDTVPADERRAPFALSAKDVVNAALSNASVEAVGKEIVRGVTTTHYRLKLSDSSRKSLKDVPSAERDWFFTDSVGDLATVDIWVADNLIRRVIVELADHSFTSDIEFYDFDAPITIKAPAAS